MPRSKLRKNLVIGQAEVSLTRARVAEAATLAKEGREVIERVREIQAFQRQDTTQERNEF
jgi:hypothetical protein